MPPARPREHGTERGYRQHLYNGEDPCEDCKPAHASWTNERREPDKRNAERRERRRLMKAGSHHVGACLDSGVVVYAEASLPIVFNMRKIHDAHQRNRLADPRDEAAVEAWARNYPEAICRLPFDACTHE